MRLQAIKLAGFKSFVDPTTVPFRGNRCAVVGPNGCGKSNIIDAVRWVMGESSAKTLRGESMADVIFNGSGARKPVGQASIELQFQDAAGRLAGEYAAYDEISVRRLVTRSGQSNYYLNGHRCRRKDVTDIFLGTGLGARSYSVIEQGMITQLIEARPEELRGYLEEAAGISLYRERRRETERRITSARDNLDRLGDLREELDKQLSHLKRQAKSAEKFTEIRSEERKVKAELIGLRWQELQGEIDKRNAEVSRLTLEQDAERAKRSSLDAGIEEKRARLNDLTDSLDEVQQRYYAQAAQIARIEESIEYQNQLKTQLNVDREEAEEGLAKVAADLQTDERQQAQLRAELGESAPKRAALGAAEAASAQRLEAAEEAMAAWQGQWDGFNQQAAGNSREGEVQQSRIAHLEETLARAKAKAAALQKDAERLAQGQAQQEVPSLEAALSDQEAQLQGIEREMAALNARIEAQRGENASLLESLDAARSRLQSLKGRHASLEALQQAALGLQDAAEVRWLEKHGLSSQPRLAERLKVADGWEEAVAWALGAHLQAVCVEGMEGMDRLAALLGDFGKGRLGFIAGKQDPAQASAPAERLASKVSGDASLAALLEGIYIAEDLAGALTRRPSLKPGESVVTRDGFWLGAAWLRVSKRPEDAEAHAAPEAQSQRGVIQRQEELERLAEEQETLEAEAADASARLDAGMAALQQAEAERDAGQARLSDQQRQQSDAKSQLTARQLEAQQLQSDLARTRKEIAENASQQEADAAALGAAKQQLQATLDRVAADAGRQQELTEAREGAAKELAEARRQAKADAEAAHQMALVVQNLEARLASTEEAMRRLKEQQQALTAKRQNIDQSLATSQAPQEKLKADLEQELEERLQLEGELAEVRRQAEAAEQEIREREGERAGIEAAIHKLRDSLEAVRIDREGLEVRRKTLEEQLEAEGEDLQEALARTPADATEAAWEKQLDRLAKRLDRLGPINLQAIQEFQTTSERKAYLDSQNDDLEKALDTLETAIRKIDQETRSRFKETFDKVNAQLQALFPKLFGGGAAYLEMTGEDLLDTGVSIMARPPGKRNTSIHLLSGGEKALAAIALVFAIFNLNPSPFCLLDEVDAPLDDANVMRYSDLVKEMSQTVQFIYITHNKLAMEMAEQLLGITMQEPGVSRLVSVDMEEALALAAV